jgi:CheY-like chemotaxis protein
VKRLLETILVVEDHDDSRQMMEDLLGQAGFRVITAANGAEALRHVRQEAPDLIVLDLILPWVNGVEVLSTIRGMPGLEKTPVLVVTATNTNAFELRAYNPLVLMRKPLNATAIVPAVQELLSRSDRPM